MPDCGHNCEETLREVERYLDGEVSAEVTVWIEQHLGLCNPCMQRTEFRRHIKVLIHDKCGEHELPPGLQERILGRIRTLETD